MVFFHHDPVNKDSDLENMYDQSVKNKNIGYDLVLGKENDIFIL